MTRAKRLLGLVASCAVYSLIVLLIDIAAIFLLKVEPKSILSTLSLIGLLEGGTALIVGSAAAFFSPVLRKVEEAVLHAEPWDAKRQKQTERQGHPWILTGVILVFESFLLSIL